MKRFFSYFFAIIAMLLMVFAILFTTLRLCVNDKGWFEQEYYRLGLSRVSGLSNEDMNAGMQTLIDYMEGRRDDIKVDVTYKGDKVKMYNSRETEHMVDVKKVYQGFVTASYAAFAGAVVFGLISVLMERRDCLKILAKSYISALSAYVAASIAVIGFALFDFTKFWTVFHNIFFKNDLWLLDPKTSRMINICPETLFIDIIVRFLTIAAVILFVILVAAIVWLVIKKQRRNTPIMRRERNANNNALQ